MAWSHTLAYFGGGAFLIRSANPEISCCSCCVISPSHYYRTKREGRPFRAVAYSSFSSLST